MMRINRGGIVFLTCTDCISNCVIITDCRTCKCQCQMDISVKKDIITMPTNKLWNDELKAHKRVPDKNERAHQNFAEILSSLLRKRFNSLSKSNSGLNEKNVLSAAAGHMSWQQMSCEEELHSLQQTQPFTTKLQISGADVQHALNADPRKKGKRHSRNNLR